MLYSLLWMTVMGLTMASGAAAVFLAYFGLVNVTGGVSQGAAPMAAALLLGVTCWQLARHSNDLIDR